MSAKPTPLSGFPELLPAARVVEREVVASLSRTFELHGFANIETRVVEPLDRLAKGGEIDKEIYVLRRLQAGDEEGDAGLGLHFDLTVPFARYVLEHAGHLEFPFRRFQIQPAWRGERPQEGRYRQFTQADVDIVGKDVLPFHHDVEVMRVMVEALDALPIPPVSFQFNNRKLIQGFYRGLGLPDLTAAIRTIDKLDKLGDRVAELLVEDAGATPEQARRCLELATIRVADTSFVERVRALGVEDDLLDEGLAELAAVVEGCAAGDHRHVTVEANLRIARGLDYYTGTVVEIFMAGYERLKSVGGGGRYDALASDGRSTYPGVGVSFGVSRTLIPLLADGVLAGSRPVPSAVLVAVTDEESRSASTAVADALRARGIPTEVAASAQKFGKQIRYAERRGIPFVWFPGRDGAQDEVKDIRSGEQVAADPAAWTPPEEDLRPQVRTSHVVDDEEQHP
ncbi:histidine--tRNA ligase [Nocardioides sp.]|uniref:histidine--tRNA ligase n=1 Tax=Nocardioides sp. TaxID=35761 RepID=UPI003783629F